jgi:PII-like signaling protein
MKHNAKLISIMTEKVFEEDILEVLEQEGAKGYTIFEGGGNGSFHLHPAQHLSLVDEFRIVKIEVIVLDIDIADRIATRLMEEYFTDQPGIVSLSDVQIFRTQKF